MGCQQQSLYTLTLLLLVSTSQPLSPLLVYAPPSLHTHTHLLACALQLLPDSWLVDYNAALATIGFMVFLGFADDVLDIPWRVKLVLPLFASLPLLVAYSGGTGVAVPMPLQVRLGRRVGWVVLRYTRGVLQERTRSVFVCVCGGGG